MILVCSFQFRIFCYSLTQSSDFCILAEKIRVNLHYNRPFRTDNCKKIILKNPLSTNIQVSPLLSTSEEELGWAGVGWELSPGPGTQFGSRSHLLLLPHQFPFSHKTAQHKGAQTSPPSSTSSPVLSSQLKAGRLANIDYK